MQRWWKRWLVGPVLFATAGSVLPIGRAGANPDLEGYVASAIAYAGRVTFTVPKFAAVEDVIDGGGPLSQSLVDPFRAEAFAALPYPGDVAIAGPGLFQAVTGVASPGGYPFYVTASYPTSPDQELKDPSGLYGLSAKSGAGTSTGVARFSGQGGQGQQSATGGSQAMASTVTESGVVTATAQTVNEGVNLGEGALRIAAVRSESATTYNGHGEPQTKTELIIEGGSAGGFSFAFGPQGLVIGQGGTPVPASSGLEQLNATLAPAGIHLGLAGVKQLAGGASANALEVSFHGKSPVPGIPDGIVTLRFGAATTTVALTGPQTGSAASTPGAATDASGVVPGSVPTPAPTGSSVAETGAGSQESADTGNDNSSDPQGATTGSSGFVASVPIAGGSEQASTDNRPSVHGAPAATLQAERAMAPRTLSSGGFLVWPLIVGSASFAALYFLHWRRKGVLRP